MVHEKKSFCILDFYVHESKQRSGFGKKLYDFMLYVSSCISLVIQKYDSLQQNTYNFILIPFTPFLFAKPVKQHLNLKLQVLGNNLQLVFDYSTHKTRCTLIHREKRKQLFLIYNCAQIMFEGSVLIKTTLLRLNLSYTGSNRHFKFKVYGALKLVHLQQRLK